MRFGGGGAGERLLRLRGVEIDHRLAGIESALRIAAVSPFTERVDGIAEPGDRGIDRRGIVGLKKRGVGRWLRAGLHRRLRRDGRVQYGARPG